jgi:hypothetical protein
MNFTKKILFPGQQENEAVYLVLREHWFYLFSRLILWFLFIIVLFALDHYVPIYVPQLLEAPYASYLELFKNVYVMFLVLGLFMIWTMYYLNIQIITGERIVELSQDGLFSHTASELGLAKIEDVTAETTGIFATIFGFGNVYVQTAGRVERFVFKNVPHPDKVEKLILDLYQKHIEQAPKPITER